MGRGWALGTAGSAWDPLGWLPRLGSRREAAAGRSDLHFRVRIPGATEGVRD